MNYWNCMSSLAWVLLIGMIVLSGCLGSTTTPADTETQNSGESVASGVLSKNLTITEAYSPEDEKLPLIKAQPNSNQFTVISTGIVGGCTQPVVSRLNYEENNCSLIVIFGTEQAGESGVCNATTGTAVLNVTFQFNDQIPQSVTVSYVHDDTITMSNVTKTVSPA